MFFNHYVFDSIFLFKFLLLAQNLYVRTEYSQILLKLFFFKFLETRLEIFKLKSLIIHIFVIELRVIFDSTLDHINKSSRIIMILLKKSFKIV